MSCMAAPNELGKAYAAAYVLLMRAQVLLTHVIVPYADLTLTNFSTSPQFRLTRGNFYIHTRIKVVIGKIKQWTMKTWKKRKMMKKYHQQKLAEHEADDFFDSTLAESTGITGEFLFQDRRRVWIWAAWATTGKSTFGLRDAYAVLTRMSGNKYAKHPLKITNVPSRRSILMHRLPVTLCICPFLMC